ncbi:hypothetical protein C8R43DRAFT_977517 [Mycena crocata]|nr:hypothetical protein C8R43DRAFT_977517 [Mycena crocata]
MSSPTPQVHSTFLFFFCLRVFSASNYLLASNSTPPNSTIFSPASPVHSGISGDIQVCAFEFLVSLWIISQ